MRSKNRSYIICTSFITFSDELRNVSNNMINCIYFNCLVYLIILNIY